MPASSSALSRAAALTLALFLATPAGCDDAFEVVPNPGGPDPAFEVFSKHVDVFGVGVYATAGVSDGKVLHAANVLAQYLDTDADGVVDDALVHAELLERSASMVLFPREGTRDEDDFFDADPPASLAIQGLYGNETRPGGSSRAGVRRDPGGGPPPGDLRRLVARLPGRVRGGSGVGDRRRHGRGPGRSRPAGPARLPPGAWYTYRDRTCDYACQVSEYVDWALTSLLGAQSYPGRLQEIRDEWTLNTAARLEGGDPTVHALLTDPSRAMPRVLPDGRYAGPAAAGFEAALR